MVVQSQPLIPTFLITPESMAGNRAGARMCSLRIKDIHFSLLPSFIVPKTVVKGMEIELYSSVREC